MQNSEEANKIFHIATSKPFLQAWMELNRANIDEEVFEAFYYFDNDIYKYLENQDIDVLENLAHTISAAISRGATERIPLYFRIYASDCYVLMEDYQSAISVFPNPPIKSRLTFQANRILSLRYYTRTLFEARELLLLFGPKVTKYCMDHLSEICRYIDVVIPKNEERIELLSSWAQSSSHNKYSIFNGCLFTYNATKLSKIEQFDFSENPIVQSFIKNITRMGENAVRDELGYPRVGEGWVSETKLFYEVKQAFSSFDVIQHASPAWLGKQHLDVYIPDLHIAFEYQGVQHDQAVDYFGGEASFLETKKRDLRKLRKCRQNGVRIIFVRPGYLLDEIIKEAISADPS